MFRLYVDESYQHDHYYVAGVLVDEKQGNILASRLDELAESTRVRNGWSSPPEFHGHALMNGLDDWAALHGKFGACVSIYQKVMHAIQNCGARIYLEGVDVRRLNARYKYPDSPHEVALRHLLERVNEYCARNGEMCEIIADTVPHQDEFNEAIQSFVRVSTPGYRSQRLLCINGDIEFVDSRNSRGVQAADMAAYILRRDREEKTASKSARRATARLVKALGPSVV
ncbi:DUF3800 domain-containing protein, partial [Corynebacterium sp.]|uniref:DUF3800 domain-containing protein n=1 Tax=Corynebacterium sp. TaxID=1720 RepID=UPI002A912FE8